MPLLAQKMSHTPTAITSAPVATVATWTCKREHRAGLRHGPWVQWAELSRGLSLLGGVDKPVAGGARTCSVGRQLLHKPLTPATAARVFFALLKLGLTLKAKTLHQNNKCSLPQKVLFFCCFFKYCSHVEKGVLSLRQGRSCGFFLKP